MVGQDVIDAEVSRLLDGVADGDPLSDRDVVLLRYALCVSSSALDLEGARRWRREALAMGVTPAELQEIITLQSAVGVHAFFEASRDLADATAPPEGWGPFDPERQQLWDRYVGSRSYWGSMHEEIHGFLEALLRLSPATFEAFIHYVAIPFKSTAVPNLLLEIISMASDACPAHQYLPGMRMHLKNAVRGGAGRRAIEGAMAVAAESPGHVGVR